jgi:anthranilate phosphoribosyltransferase
VSTPLPPAHPFAGFVKLLGRGKTARRSLTETEAEEAFAMILRGAATDAQTGAFLMLLRVKEETPEEITGMVRAARAHCARPAGVLLVDLDWPSYAGKRQHHPWYLLAALLLADAGFRVLMHGCAPHAQDRLFAVDTLGALGIAPDASWDQAARSLQMRNFSDLPLRALSPELQHLLDMRAEFGLRSPVNTLLRHLDPAGARAGLRSLHHPAYARLHVESAVALGNRNVAVFRGEGGECEVRADADTPLALVRTGATQDMTVNRALAQRSGKPDALCAMALRGLWNETVPCVYGLESVLGTVSVALLALGHANDLDAGRAAARAMWQQRGALPEYFA